MAVIGLIGAGFMGGSLARAMQRDQSHVSFLAIDKRPERIAELRGDIDLSDVSADPERLITESDFVILAIKPQDLDSVADRFPGSASWPPVVSVLAGTPIERVRAALGAKHVVRIMPNLAAEIGQAVIGATFPDSLDPGTASDIRKMLSTAGTVMEIPESAMHAVTGLSGSGIAFAFEFIQGLALGGTAEGIPYPQSLSAAIDVVASAAAILRHAGAHPEEMVSRVTSPAGTTIAGIRSLKADGFEASVANAVAKAARRSRELEG